MDGAASSFGPDTSPKFNNLSKTDNPTRPSPSAPPPPPPPPPPPMPAPRTHPRSDAATPGGAGARVGVGVPPGPRVRWDLSDDDSDNSSSVTANSSPKQCRQPQDSGLDAGSTVIHNNMPREQQFPSQPWSPPLRTAPPSEDENDLLHGLEKNRSFLYDRWMRGAPDGQVQAPDTPTSGRGKAPRGGERPVAKENFDFFYNFDSPRRSLPEQPSQHTPTPDPTPIPTPSPSLTPTPSPSPSRSRSTPLSSPASTIGLKMAPARRKSAVRWTETTLSADIPRRFSRPSVVSAAPVPARVVRPPDTCATRRHSTVASFRVPARVAWAEYAHDAHVDGLRQISEPQRFTARRIIWILFLLISAALFLYGTVLGVLYYYTWPVSVTMTTAHKKTLTFPAITLCNTNAFRATAAADQLRYFLITDMFVDVMNSRLELSRYDAEDVTLTDLYLNASHRLEDFVISCQWEGEPCAPGDFETTLTDFGVCYTFNGAAANGTKITTKKGAAHGLRLVLNIEQYEYMPGPNEGAGIKVLVHQQDDVAMVRDYGTALPPGSHASIGLQPVQMHELPLPYGLCTAPKNLTLHDTYSKTNCIESCKQSYVEQECGCRDLNMMPGPDYFPVCTLTQFVSCLARINDHFKRDFLALCDCPVECERTVYEKVTDFSYISNYDALALLNSNMTSQLSSAFIRSRDVAQRALPDMINEDRSMISEYIVSLVDIDKKLRQILYALDEVEVKVDSLMEEMNLRTWFHLNKGLKGVEYIIQNDFIRGWDVMKERILLYVNDNFQSFASSFMRFLTQIEENIDTPDVSEALWLILDNQLVTRRMRFDRAFQNITAAYNSYENASPLQMYELTKDGRYDESYITVQILNKDGDHRRRTFQLLRQATQKLETAVDMYRDIGQAYLKRFRLNKTALDEAEDIFLTTSKNYNLYMENYELTVILSPVDGIQEKLEEFQLVNRSLHEARHGLQQTLNLVRSEIETMNKTDWEVLMMTAMESTNYMYNITYQKRDLADKLSSKQVQLTLISIHQFFTNLRSRGLDLNDNWLYLRKAYVRVWEVMANEFATEPFYAAVAQDARDYYTQVQSTGYLQEIFADLLGLSPAEVAGIPENELTQRLNSDLDGLAMAGKVAEIEAMFAKLDGDTDIGIMLGESDDRFEEAVDHYFNYQHAYILSTDIDMDFYLDNFMKVDIYMKDMCHEEVVQKPTYDIIKLLGDVGGLAVLFLGASFVSLFEIMDVLTNQMIRCNKERRLKRRKNVGQANRRG